MLEQLKERAISLAQRMGELQGVPARIQAKPMPVAEAYARADWPWPGDMPPGRVWVVALKGAIVRGKSGRSDSGSRSARARW